MKRLPQWMMACTVLLWAGACSDVEDPAAEEGAGGAVAGAGGAVGGAGGVGGMAQPMPGGGVLDTPDMDLPQGGMGGEIEPGEADAEVGEPDEGAADPPDAMVPPEPETVTCVFEAPEGEQEVNTWRSDVDRVVFNVPGVPEVGGVEQAILRFRGHDLDHPGEEGWVRVNGNERIALPADEANDNVTGRVDLDVSGQVVAGDNRVAFLAFERPDGSFYRISDVRLVLTGQVACPDPMMPEEPEPLDRVANETPLGVSAFAALSPRFPHEGLWQILGALDRPFTTVLLDFEPVYDEHGLAMFADGAVGNREPNAAHLDALDDFIDDFVAATPEADGRHLQIYLFNGPGIRRTGYARAFDLDAAGFDDALQNNDSVRADVLRFAQALVGRLATHLGEVDIRLVGTLEDNLTRPGARALNRLLREAGWEGDLGRNPCGCGPMGDDSQVGQFIEHHPHSVGATEALANTLEAPDALSNDGWGFNTDSGTGFMNRGHVAPTVAAAQAAGVWFHFWYDPLQGYPIPAQGARNLRFDDAPATVLGWLADGVRDIEPGPDLGEPTGLGVEVVQGYRDATYDPRRNWVLDCRDYAYSARGDEHEECDNRYNPDGTTHGTATFVFEGVPRDLYTVALEGRHTENRNPAGALVIVNGVERRIRQIGEGEYTFVDHGTYMLEGRVEVVLDSRREVGSDAVRRVRIRPVSP
ncbi:MAG: hypothetical protein ACE366_01540 [Bradymonadia bacterium]